MIDMYADETPDATQRRCYDCAYLKGAVSLWCMNDQAAEARMTRIPGVRSCRFWSPMPMAPKWATDAGSVSWYSWLSWLARWWRS